MKPSVGVQPASSGLKCLFFTLFWFNFVELKHQGSNRLFVNRTMKSVSKVSLSFILLVLVYLPK